MTKQIDEQPVEEEQPETPPEETVPVFLCGECGEEYAWSENLVDRSKGYIAGLGEVYETGMICPHCDYFTIVCFINDGLLRGREHLAKRLTALKENWDDYSMSAYGEELERYKKRFDSFNRSMAIRFKVRLSGQEEWDRKKLLSKHN